MKFDTIDFMVGDYFLSAIINGDYTGLGEGEEADLEAFLAEHERKDGHWATGSEEDSEDFTLCEVTGLYGKCEKLIRCVRV